MDLDGLTSYKVLLARDNVLAAQVRQVYDFSKETINGISECYNNFTMHNMEHGFRVAKYMENLAYGIENESMIIENAKRFSPLENALLITTAILHDIGMYITAQDKIDIPNNIIKHTDKITYEGVFNVKDKNENETIKEIVRLTHADRVEDLINYEIEEKSIAKLLNVNAYNYSEDVIKICKAHGEDYNFVRSLSKENVKANYSFNTQYWAVLLRIADYLDIDKERTPMLWYKLNDPQGFSNDEWEKHFMICNTIKFKATDINNKLQIFFNGSSSNANIHRKFLRYIDELKIELENADDLLNINNQKEKYRFNVLTKIDNSVETKGFNYADLRLSLNYEAITTLLMGENIYGEKKLGLREILQNSIDACRLMNEENKKNIIYRDIDPSIKIIISKSKNYVKIRDSGVGMTLDIIKKHFLNVGKSYYKSNEFNYRNYDYQPIGKFGIGFLACFLLSDSVIVRTKHFSDQILNQIELEKNSEYVVTKTEQGVNVQGTEIILNYKKFFEVFDNIDDIKCFVEKYFIVEIKISIYDEDENKEYECLNDIKKNIIQQIYDKLLEENKNFILNQIDCKKYSNNLDGKILIKNKKQSIKIEKIDKKNSMIFKDNKFISIEEKLDNGLYIIIPYCNIERDELNKIKNSTKKDLYSALINYGKKEKKIINLFVNQNKNKVRNTFVSYEKIQISINDKPLNELMNDSQLFFIDDFYDRFYELDRIFFFEENYVKLEYNSIRFFVYEKIDQHFLIDKFYNNGIWVPEVYIYFYTPFKIEIESTIVNNIKLQLGLDVSRKKLIDGIKELSCELQMIIINFENENCKNEQLKTIASEMIKFNKYKQIEE